MQMSSIDLRLLATSEETLLRLLFRQVRQLAVRRCSFDPAVPGQSAKLLLKVQERRLKGLLSANVTPFQAKTTSRRTCQSKISLLSELGVIRFDRPLIVFIESRFRRTLSTCTV